MLLLLYQIATAAQLEPATRSLAAECLVTLCEARDKVRACVDGGCVLCLLLAHTHIAGASSGPHASNQALFSPLLLLLLLLLLPCPCAASGARHGAQAAQLCVHAV
jgi:hypothetical protein